MRTSVAKLKAKQRILIVDDHPIVRHGLANLLNDTPELEVCGEAGDAQQALELVEKLNPNLALVDLFLHGVVALDLIGKIRKRRPDLPVLVLSIQNEAVLAERALRAGADGYVVKEEATKEILEAIQTLLEGGVYVSRHLIDKLGCKLSARATGRGADLVEKLSNRELQVFRLIGDGVNVREIADRLNLSAKTVETHCARIKKKLGMKNASELLRYAAQRSLDPMSL